MNFENKIIIDESMPKNQLENISRFLKRKGITFSDFHFIANEHPGIPDYQIIHFLLDKSTIFFTTDSPFHNAIIQKGFKSFYFNGDNFSSKMLKGVRSIKLPSQIKKDLQLKDNYHQPKTEIRHLILPKSEKSLKKLRTKRRRIKSHFGDTENMAHIAVTVSCKPLKSSTLIGLKFRISSNSGIKALDASESYIREEIDPGDIGIVALNYSLILAIQLMLNNVKTIIFFDPQIIEDPKIYFHNINSYNIY